MDDVPTHINHQTSARRHDPGRLKGPWRFINIPKNNLKLTAIFSGVVIAVAILVLGGLFIYSSSTGSSIDSNKYQAIFFTNGQVYFGKLHTLNGEYMRLTDIFYLQAKASTSANPQQTSAKDSSDVQLIKLGSEIHGPDDEMIISKNQILFFENLKKDSRVSSTIVDYKRKK